MQILAITDLHADKKRGSYVNPSIYFDALAKRAAKADIIVCSGDISIFGMELMEVLEAMQSWKKPVYLIHGNHEDPDLLIDVHKHYSNLHFVHNNEHIFEGYSIYGWGGGGFAQTDKKLIAATKKLKPTHKRIILFHGPPHGTLLDKIGDEHCGNESYTEVIKKLQPFLAVCGHIHENIGKRQMIGKTLLLNPGPTGIFVNVK